MDDRHFDNLARSVARSASRRHLLRLLLTTATTGVLSAITPPGAFPGRRNNGVPGVAEAKQDAGGEDGDTVVLLAAGDIASCDSIGDDMTADLLDEHEGTILLLGDTAYQSGTPEEFEECYEPTWGRHKDRTYPSLGDHEYNTPGASGYFDYFGDVAGDRDKGYYSFDLGAWHIVVLNANCSKVGGCEAGSPQEQWLREDLAAHPAPCTLAAIHVPRFSSGTTHGSNPAMSAFWDALYEAGADVVLSGNEHNYERFAPQTPDGIRDDRQGIRQIIVGTGGVGHYPIGPPIANSEVRNDEDWGILKMTLRPGSYDWEFIPVEGQSFTDSGSGVCNPLVREFSAVADVTVREEDPAANFGEEATLEVDSDPQAWTYLRFEVEDVDARVESAHLRLYAPPGEATGRGPEVFGVDADWSESSLTWENQPEITGGPFGSVDGITEGSWIDIDVSEAVTGNGSYAFALQPRSDDGIGFVSRDNLFLQPLLVLTLRRGS
ncbi:MAG: DNRLRE domain-containing protein [Thermomicrobiales bacterium]